jgi:hypothetical protein
MCCGHGASLVRGLGGRQDHGTRAVCHILYELPMNSVLHDMIDKKLEEEAGLWEHGPPLGLHKSLYVYIHYINLI